MTARRPRTGTVHVKSLDAASVAAWLRNGIGRQAMTAWLERRYVYVRQLENLLRHVLVRHDVAVHRYLLLRDKARK